MKLLNITLEDFKVYQGINTLDCDTLDNKKPLILIGGNNGAGKTSIIEAVKLCLYGDNAKQLLKDYTSYNKFLEEIHNHQSKARGKKNFSISLRFQMIEKGLKTVVLVKREWTLVNKRYSERLILMRDGKDVEFIKPEFWQDYINKLAPIGLADLIFFDSEEFRRVPQYLENGFISSLLNYFGIEQYQRLNKDLRKYQLYIESKTNPELEDEIVELEALIKSSQLEIDQINNDKNTLKTKLEKLKNSQSELKNKLKRRSGKMADKRDELIEKKEEVVKKLEEVNIEYNDICANLLPFTFCADLNEELVSELNSQIKQTEANQSIDFIKSFKVDFEKKLSNSFKNNDLKEISKMFDAALPSKSKKAQLHDVTQTQAHKTIILLSETIQNSREMLTLNRNKHNKLISQREKLTRTLREIQPKGPDQEIYQDLLDNEVNQKKNETQLLAIPSKIEKLKKTISGLKHKIDIAGNKFKKSKELLPRISAATKARALLNEFSSFLSIKRFEDFRSNFLKVIDRLTVKGDLVCDINLDIEERKIAFLDNNGNRLSIRDFSAGESEIVALSVLWAINKTSGKNHPIITDSPLNRLDSKHRERFVDNFIKKSSNQIVFLSTDEELSTIDDFGVSEYISKEYLIDHNYSNKSSKFKEGYYMQ
tara:strand:- start:247 stop:2202 length:1956 start_codon:yes stop_codon:yes gene_type:complete